MALEPWIFKTNCKLIVGQDEAGKYLQILDKVSKEVMDAQTIRLSESDADALGRALLSR